MRGPCPGTRRAASPSRSAHAHSGSGRPPPGRRNAGRRPGPAAVLQHVEHDGAAILVERRRERTADALRPRLASGMDGSANREGRRWSGRRAGAAYAGKAAWLMGTVTHGQAGTCRHSRRAAGRAWCRRSSACARRRRRIRHELVQHPRMRLAAVSSAVREPSNRPAAPCAAPRRDRGGSCRWPRPSQ